ncbi:MAG TPA: rhomboid family intramembrane serine protease [Ktedonobacterales bacterium]
MDQVTDARGLASRGEELLLQGKVAEAGAEFSQAAQLDPQLANAHLGLAEVNLALGAYSIVYIACRRVLGLAPESADGAVARAILAVLDRRYEEAVTDLEQAEKLDPGRPYVHALRGYALRQLGRNGDAALAEAKSARLSGNRELSALFPKVETTPTVTSAPSPFAVQPVPAASPAVQAAPNAPGTPRPWSERSQLERRMVRWRFLTSNNAIVTKALIAVNVAVYVLCALLSLNLLNPLASYYVNRATGILTGAPNPIYSFGLMQGLLIAHDPIQAYRLVTSMFLHIAWWHIGINMWSLWAVGVITERIFGSGKYLLIYFVAGIVGGATQAILGPDVVALGASGAIFGIFGAFGAFILMRRRQLGPAANFYIGQWVFFLAINLVISFGVGGISAADHMGGLVSGFIIGAIFVLTAGNNRSRRRYIV